MPKVFSFRGYTLYFWTAENGEPVHIHVAKGRPTPNATKIWLTRSGGCILANNGSHIRQGDLREILEFVALNHERICERWRETFQGDLHFHC
jgi:hypothetical protein